MSDSKEKKKENEESAQEDEAVTIALPNHKAAQADAHEHHDSSVPVDQTLIQTLNGTPPLPEYNKIMESWSNPDQPTQDSPDSPGPLNDDKDLLKPNTQTTSDVKIEDNDLPPSNLGCEHHQNNTSSCHVDTAGPDVSVAKDEPCQVRDTKLAGDTDILPATTTIHNEPAMNCAKASDIKYQIQNGRQINMEVNEKDVITPVENGNSSSKHFFLLGNDHMSEGNESGTEEEQSAFMKELENFFRERSTEFKPPKFYGEGLNCLKLWRAVTRLGGYDKVTSCKLWRQVGESFKPPKTCTTVSWTFRGFYEKALLSYERHKAHGGELNVPIASHSEPMNIENQASGSGRARRDAAARAMQGWHSQRLLGNGEVSDPIIKDKNSISMQKREKQLKNIGLLKRKKPSYMEHTVKAARTRASKPQLDSSVVDIGPAADWVKINVQKTKDCFEVYALVPGLLREEVRVQSDPSGRLVISGEPEHTDNPWGVTPFKKVVSLPSRIDPHQTSAVVTLHGQLFVRVPFGQS
ncbi:hypothetical protein F2P56_019472 [Juglans regia]|uniref:AT-rich interactive domain-containing protein 6-like n=2 Tax=Juglans regia TaxID=51240 RepID=A0A2I4FTM2_JUGRE|nr:AT-rich interactive domain-containing protein 6-like [Juglans regia]XP_018834999.2 AT-rich interactive domain-containing protein 6-like [Juglans regia]KAF5463569.1 hypothetical protein F2P56_019472 [Juglans regia]